MVVSKSSVLSSIKRGTNSFRMKLKTRPKAGFLCSMSACNTPQATRKTPNSQPQFTLDNFLVALQEHGLLQSEESEKVRRPPPRRPRPNSFKDTPRRWRFKDALAKTPLKPMRPIYESESRKFEELPTKWTLDMLRHLEPQDVLAFRLTSKTSDSLVQKHALELPRVSLPFLTLVGHPREPHLVDVGKDLWMPVHHLDRPLRHVMAEELTLCEVFIDLHFTRHLSRSIKYDVCKLVFLNCKISIGPDDLSFLLSCWHCDEIEFHECEIVACNDLKLSSVYRAQPSPFLDDKFFGKVEAFKFLCFDFDFQKEQYLAFTDRHMITYFTYTNTLPNGIFFKNCITDITSKTLFAAISKYIDKCSELRYRRDPTLPLGFTWSLGRIRETRDQILASLKPYADYAIVTDVSEERIEITYKAAHFAPTLELAVDLVARPARIPHNNLSLSEEHCTTDGKLQRGSFPPGHLQLTPQQVAHFFAHKNVKSDQHALDADTALDLDTSESIPWDD